MGRAPAAGLMACGAGGRAGLHPLGDALQDGGNAEQVVGEVEIPVGLQSFGRGEARAVAVQADVLGFRGNAQAGDVKAADAAERARRDVPGHAVVAEVGQRVAQGGEFPVEHGKHARLGRVEHQVVEPVVAMHDADHGLVASLGGDVRRQPCHQLVHLGDRLGDGGHVLLAPAADLALEIVAGLAVAGKAALGELHGVQRGDHAVHLVVDGAALAVVHAGQGLVPQDAALHELHDVEGTANDRFVFAQARACGPRAHRCRASRSSPQIRARWHERKAAAWRQARAWRASHSFAPGVMSL